MILRKTEVDSPHGPCSPKVHVLFLPLKSAYWTELSIHRNHAPPERHPTFSSFSFGELSTLTTAVISSCKVAIGSSSARSRLKLLSRVLEYA